MKLILINIAFFTLCSCATTGWYTPIGVSLVNVTTLSGELGYDNGKKTKKGKACTRNILGLVSFGDSSFTVAKKEGGISRVFYSDMEIINVWGWYGHVCTIVTGI